MSSASSHLLVNSVAQAGGLEHTHDDRVGRSNVKWAQKGRSLARLINERPALGAMPAARQSGALARGPLWLRAERIRACQGLWGLTGRPAGPLLHGPSH